MLSEKVNNNITQTTVKLITCKLKDIFYNLINDMCDLYEREDNGDIPEEFLPLINKVRECVHRISEELNKDPVSYTHLDVYKRQLYIPDVQHWCSHT